MRSELITKTGSETWNFLRSQHRPLLLRMLKVQLISFIIVIVTLIASGGILILSGAGAIAGLGGGILMVLLAAAGFFLVGIFLASVADCVGYNAVDATFRRTEFRFTEGFSANIGPFLKYSIVILLIYFIAFAPFLALFFLVFGLAFLGGSSGSGEAVLVGQFGQIALRIILTVVGSILYLFTQFAILELLLGKRGVIDSFRHSYGIMMRYPLETVVFSFGLWAAQLAVGIPFGIAIFGLVMAAFIGAFLAAAVPVLTIPLLMAGVLVLVALVVASTVVQASVLISAQYVYWNKVKAGREPSY